MRFGFLGAALIAGVVAGPRLQSLVSSTAPTPVSLADLLPLRPIYDHVIKTITSGENRTSFAVGTPLPEQDWTALSALTARFKSEFDPATMSRINGENAATQIREFNDRQEDLRNYARNPAGWRGAPPF